MKEISCKLLVVGAGPGGYVCAIRAGQLGIDTVVIAPGSAPVELPGIPFADPVISSTDALALREVPAKLAVIGGGYIGLELGTAFAKLGSKVTVVEALPRILPLYDAELTRPVGKRLVELGV